MEQEAADELVDADGGRAVARLSLPGPGRLPVPEGDPLAIESDDATVGDGDPVSVSGEVAEDLLRPPKGPLGVDDPVFAAGGGEGVVERAGIGEMGDIAVEGDLALAMGAGDLLKAGCRLPAL